MGVQVAQGLGEVGVQRLRPGALSVENLGSALFRMHLRGVPNLSFLVSLGSLCSCVMPRPNTRNPKTLNLLFPLPSRVRFQRLSDRLIGGADALCVTRSILRHPNPNTIVVIVKYCEQDENCYWFLIQLLGLFLCRNTLLCCSSDH